MSPIGLQSIGQGLFSRVETTKYPKTTTYTISAMPSAKAIQYTIRIKHRVNAEIEGTYGRG